MAATGAARALLLSRFSDLSLKPYQHLPTTSTILSSSCHHHHRQLHLCSSTSTTKRPSSSLILNCLFSGIDGGGGVADDFISAPKSGFDREFSVIANMLKRIEPFDTTTISKGVSTDAKDSMIRTISNMLGLLPSEQFSVTIRVSKRPFHRLLANSIMTGYTLWNAEYRVALTRNFDLSTDDVVEMPVASTPSRGVLDNECGKREGDGDLVEMKIPEGLGDLTPEALRYIQELKSELATVEKELNSQKQENIRLKRDREKNNDLLDYLRSLEPDMVSELSNPSSLEVEEVIEQLVQNVMQKLYKEDTGSGFFEDLVVAKVQTPDGNLELCDTVGTSRDYLAKLLFWFVHAVGSSLERLGVQIAPKLRGRVVVKDFSLNSLKDYSGLSPINVLLHRWFEYT